MQSQLLAHPPRISPGDYVAAPRGLSIGLRYDDIFERDVPPLRLRVVIVSHERAGNRRRLARVLIPLEFNSSDVRIVGEVQRNILTTELRRTCIRIVRECLQMRTLPGH